MRKCCLTLTLTDTIIDRTLINVACRIVFSETHKTSILVVAVEFTQRNDVTLA
jgi:hypothetical protein